MPHRAMPSPRDYENRGVFIDYLGRFAWSVDSQGRKSEIRIINPEEDPLIVGNELQAELDEDDPILPDSFVPAPIARLRLL